MKKLLCSLSLTVSLAVLINGCVSYQLPKPEIATQSSKSDLSAFKKFYVIRDDESGAQDEKHVLVLQAVQDVLSDHGMPATAGPLSATPKDTECKVIIHDTWFWDMHWYLLSLDVKFYDATSNTLLATGYDRRAQPSIRRSPEFMANELIEAIFPTSAGTKMP